MASVIKNHQKVLQMGFISTDRNQMNLFGYSLNDFVPKDAKCRFVADIVSRLDLNELYQRYSNQGNYAFEPSIMLSTWFYAYSEGLSSTRKVEEKCQRDLHYMFVSGNLKPDHTSLSRFRKTHIDLISDYFVQIVKIAVESGLSDFKQIAIDGSKIQASSSAKHTKTSEELSQYLVKVRRDIEIYMRQCDLLDEDLSDLNTLEEIRHKIEHLKQKEQELLTHQKKLDARKKTLKAEHRKNHKINTAEPEARNMNKVNGKQKLPAYNVQIGVDTQTQLIVANETVTDSNDYDQLARQHKNVESNLGPAKDRCYIYDAGYHNLEQLEYIHTNQINAFVVSPRKVNNEQERSFENKEKFEHTDFVYNHRDDYYKCPAGNHLVYEKDYCKANKWSGKVYKTDACPGCPLRKQCLAQNKNSKYRRIRREHREIYAEWMQKQGQTEQGKQKQRIRSTTVEPAFGNLKANLGFRRFRLKGQKLVSGEFNLMCIAHNLNKLFKIMANPIPGLQISSNYLKTLCQRTLMQYFIKIRLILPL